jgi:enoyl-CoA hydratase
VSDNIVLYDVAADGVATITMNRPEKLNAMSRPLIDGVMASFQKGFEDPAVKVLVLKGNGRAFCAGADLSPTGTTIHGPESVPLDAARITDNVERWLRVWHGPKPVIAQVHGFCMGGGAHLASFADIIVTAENAVIGWPKLPVGGAFISPVWMWFVGARKAKELSFVIGNEMSGAEAQELGWANHAVPADELDAFVLKMARRIALVPADVLRIKKEAINHCLDAQGFSNAVRQTGPWDALAHASPGVDRLRAEIREIGMKKAIEWFNEGGLGQAMREEGLGA